MKVPFIPDVRLDTIFEITSELLKNRGISLLLLDLDNTLLPYSLEHPDQKLLDWIGSLKNNGIELFIISNNRGKRPGNIAPRLDVPFVSSAKKPDISEIKKAMIRFKKTKGETALAGDQVYIDALAAHRAGILKIIVKPISLKNPLLAVRYLAEIPFRLMRKKGIWEV